MQTTERAAPAGPLLLVSPHIDDAVLSCFALLSRGEAVDVLDVLAGSGRSGGAWDTRFGFGDSAEALRARRVEEEAAFAGLPHRLELLDLVDTQHIDGERPAEHREVIVGSVGRWLDRAGAGWVALPAAAGLAPTMLERKLRSALRRISIGSVPWPLQHPDHRFVRDVLLPVVLARPEFDVLLYEELPYLWGGDTDRAVRGIAEAFERQAEPLELAVDREEKARRISSYASQIEFISPPAGRVDDPAVLPAVERYWRLAPRQAGGVPPE